MFVKKPKGSISRLRHWHSTCCDFLCENLTKYRDCTSSLAAIMIFRLRSGQASAFEVASYSDRTSLCRSTVEHSNNAPQAMNRCWR